MIADSPYRTSEPLLAPGEGALAGAVASLCMLPALSLLHPPAGLSTSDLLLRVGQATVPYAAALGSTATLLTAGAVHVLVGALLGVLFAVSQDRAPLRTLLAVGVFYGVVIWVAGRLIAALVFGPGLRAVLHSSSWLLVCVLYGLLLGGWAACIERRRPRDDRVVPVD